MLQFLPRRVSQRSPRIQGKCALAQVIYGPDYLSQELNVVAFAIKRCQEIVLLSDRHKIHGYCECNEVIPSLPSLSARRKFNYSKFELRQFFFPP